MICMYIFLHFNFISIAKLLVQGCYGEILKPKNNEG